MALKSKFSGGKLVVGKKTAAAPKLATGKAPKPAVAPKPTTMAAGGGVNTDTSAYVAAINPSFGADINAAQLNLSTMLQRNQQLRSQLGSEYGFGVDASGNVVNDPSNPFSKAAALQTSYDVSQRATTNSMAARGQLYSGALQRGQDWNTTQNQKGRDALLRAFQGARSQLDYGDQDARNAYTNAVTAAQAAAAQAALEQQRAQQAAWVQVQQGMAAQQAAQQRAAAQRAVAQKQKPGLVMGSKKLVGRR